MLNLWKQGCTSNPNPQLAVLVHYLSRHFCVEEELLDIVALVRITQWCDCTYHERW